jgi:predicted NAD/FAD-dependent oxidoreductase
MRARWHRYYSQGAAPQAVPSRPAKRWRAAITEGDLRSWSRLDEDAIVLERFALAVCGDFVRRHACPVEAAALSGLDAGERVGAWLARR